MIVKLNNLKNITLIFKGDIVINKDYMRVFAYFSPRIEVRGKVKVTSFEKSIEKFTFNLKHNSIRPHFDNICIKSSDYLYEICISKCSFKKKVLD